MQDFKKFIIQVQTFVVVENIQSANDDHELVQLREFALTDILSLPHEQVLQQLNRLEIIYQIFLDFKANYITIPDYIRDDHKQDFFYSLELDSYFKIVQESKILSPNITEQFLYELLNLISKRQTFLLDFIRSIKKTMPTEKIESNIKIEAPPPQTLNSIPTFKTEIIEDLFALLKDYFTSEDQSELMKLLQNTAITYNKLLLFNGNGNQLADAFKQLFDAHLIVGSNKAQLNQWIQQHFSYKDKNSQRNYTEKYLNDIISSDTKSCQSPILDVKKKEGGDYGIFATQRIKKNYKKY